MIRVDTRALLALYDRRLDVASSISAAHAEDTAVNGVRALARVEALLADGQFRATVANQVLNLALPAGTRVGDQVPVRMVDGTWVHSATGASAPIAAKPISAPLAGLAEGETSVLARLSPAVRWVSELIEQAGTPAQRPAILASRALLTQPPQEPRLLAQAIHRAIGESGLFYEAHQAQWVSGARSLSELRTEPQGRLPPLPALANLTAAPPPAARPAISAALAPAAAAPTTPVEAAPAPTIVNQATEYLSVAALALTEEEAPSNLPREPLAEATTARPVESAVKSTGSAVHADALPLVRQQLEVLEQPVLAWRGEFWPGQAGEIELGEDRAAPGEPGAERIFATRLALELPRLGPVEAVLRISGKSLQVRVMGQRDDAASEMGLSLAELRQALSSLGLRVEELQVGRG